MKFVRIFAMLLICQFGFGQAASQNEFRLDKKYTNQNITQNKNLIIPPYSLNLVKELTILGIGGTMMTVGLILKSNLDPLTIEEVELLDPMDVNSFDRGAITKRLEMPAADFLLYSSMFLPFTLFAYEETREDFQTLAVMAGEVFVLQLGLNYLAKALTQRIRPYCYEKNSPLSEKTTVNAKLSFFSGHTSTTAAMSFFVAKVFSDYLSNPDVKFLIWTSAALYPALTGLLRIDSGNHFPTDSFFGYLVGALIGYFIPVLHRNKLKDNLALNTIISNDHVALRVSYSF